MCICKQSNQVKLLKVCINTDSDDTAADNLDHLICLSDMMTLSRTYVNYSRTSIFRTNWGLGCS